MSEVQAMGFFVMSIFTILAAVVGFGSVNYIAKYRAKKVKERKELEEAAKMFEQRIALKPKHMGARIGLGVASDVHFESGNDGKE